MDAGSCRPHPRALYHTSHAKWERRHGGEQNDDRLVQLFQIDPFAAQVSLRTPYLISPGIPLSRRTVIGAHPSRQDQSELGFVIYGSYHAVVVALPTEEVIAVEY